MVTDAASATRLMHKLLGGLPETPASSIEREHVQPLCDLLDSLEHQLDIPVGTPEHTSIRQQIDTIKQSLASMSIEAAEALSAMGADNPGWSGAEVARAHVGVRVVDLNNIRPPKVAQQVFERCRHVEPWDKMTIDEFFRLHENPAFPGRELNLPAKVSGVLMMLAMLGFNPDPGIADEGVFTNSQSDHSHSSMAVFCEHFFSMDRRLVVRTRAAYEYLGVATQVHLVKANGSTWD